MKRFSDIDELGLIARIRRSQSSGRAVILGIGDDAAALRISPGYAAVATTDTLVEGTHFDLRYTSYYDLGWKAMAANLSDVAAMGGRPLAALAALTLTGRQRASDVDGLYRGMRELADRFRVAIAGGDVVRGRGLSATLTIIGECRRDNLGLRSGARPGDAVLVTGTLGGSAAGLALINSKFEYRKSKSVYRHLRPEPRVREGMLLSRHFKLHGMIDVSDGLASELWHLSRESRVRIAVDQGALPVAPEAVAAAAKLGGDPVDHCLRGGEDYELLFTLPPGEALKAKALLVRTGTPCAVIGQACEGRGVALVGRDGRSRKLEDRGFRHF